MRGRSSWAGLLMVCLLAAIPDRGWSGSGVGPEPKPGSQESPRSASESPTSPAQLYFTDVVLLNQDGQPMRFYTDLLQEKVVVIQVFFTRCTGSCPVLGKSFAAIQEWLGDRLGKEVHLLSISVDPEADAPARLKEYAKRFGARPGWYFLGGPKENVELALHKLGQRVEDPAAHSNIFIVGNEATGLWKKVFGLADVQELIRIVEGVLNDRG